MADYPEVLNKMLSIWNSKNTRDIELLTHEVLDANVHFVDPNYDIVGHAAFIEMVHTVQKQIPGAKYSHVGNVGHHHNVFRYHWAIHMDGQLLMPGFDVTEVSDTGKIIKIIGFFGELN